jgi:hypothetical protein
LSALSLAWGDQFFTRILQILACGFTPLRYAIDDRVDRLSGDPQGWKRRRNKMSKKIYIPIFALFIVALVAGVWTTSKAYAQDITPGRRPHPWLRLARLGLGQVKAVASDGFTVQKLNGDEVSFLVDEGTRFLNRDKEELSLDDLVVGGWVIVVPVRGEQQQKIARLVLILPEDFDPEKIFEARVAGRVVSVADDSFTIEDRDGEQHTIQVTDDTRFRSRRGVVRGLADLKEGMIVVVGGDDLGDGSYLAKLVVVGRLRR